MILNPIGLMQESTTLSSVAPINEQSLKETSHSFFIETLKFLSEMNVDFYEANRSFYLTLNESANSADITVVHESFGDFFSKIKEIIDKFLAFLKSLLDRFITLMNQLIGRDKHIINHKKDFDNFSKIHEFSIDGFNYTIMDDIPVVEALAAFEDKFIFEFRDGDNAVTFSSQKNADVVSKLKALTTAMADELISGDWYDKFRSRVIGDDNGSIHKDDFADKLFATFRNNESIAEEITIDHSEVKAALRRFETAKSDLDKAKKTKARIESDYNSIKRRVEKMVVVSRNGSTNIAKFDDELNTGNFRANTKDEIIAMDNFVKAKVNQIQEMSNIHALAFAAKLDAMRDSYRQDKTVLFKALSRVQSNKKED